jgi:hypothetical protein
MNLRKIATSISITIGILGMAQASQAARIFPTKQALLTPRFKFASSSGNLQYFGGPVISTAKVYAVYWGPKVDGTVKAGIGNFYKALVTSDHMDWLTEYKTNLTGVNGHGGSNQDIGRGTYGGEFTIAPKNTSNNLQDKDVQNELEAQVAANALPVPDDNTLYMIHFPPGVKITVDGQSSCSAFCAYHEGFVSQKLGNMFYGVMPDLGSGACSFGCGFGGSAFDSTTIVSSHEATEAITDPFPTPGSSPAYPQAWNTTDGSEIGDLCAESTAKVVSPSRTYNIQGEYDNSTSSCKSGTYHSTAQ